jgi:hypothetical protein
MKLRQLAAGVVLTAVATVGGVGIAYAADTPGTNGPATVTTATPHGRDFCAKAEKRLPKLEQRRDQSQRRIDMLKDAIVKARAHHRDELVKKLEARLDKTQKRHDKVVDLINKIHARCGDGH